MSTGSRRGSTRNIEHVDLSARRVRAARADKGWTQAELAERAGVSRNTLATIEHGGSVSARTAFDVARALDLVGANGGAPGVDIAEVLKQATDTELLAEVAARLARRPAVG